MKRISIQSVWLCAALTLAGCTNGVQNAVPPTVFTPTNGVLEVAVGTVNFAGGAAGLNVLETDRAPSGYTAYPDNTMTLSGPAGFIGPAGSLDPGSGSALVPLGANADNFPLASNVVHLAAADGSGVGPPGSSASAVSPFPVQPQFLDAVPGASAAYSAQRGTYGGPPAFPPPSGSPGYPEGFYLLALSAGPPSGAYTLAVAFSQNGIPESQQATATLGSNALLPTLATPTYTSDGLGGGSGSVNVPAGVSEVLINITDVTSPTVIRATAVVHGSGVQTYTIPDSLGFQTGDSLRVQGFGFDYPAIELVPPLNISQTPSLPSQADVTVSPRVAATE